eukprot:IDg2658t1
MLARDEERALGICIYRRSEMEGCRCIRAEVERSPKKRRVEGSFVRRIETT